jgi:DNA topoisomerase-3
MPKQLILAEKPSQAQDIAKGLNDNFSRNDGYLEGNRYVISWGYGHLIELEEPDAYDERYSKWSLEDLPIIPERFKYRVSKDGAKQFKIIKSIVGRQDVESIIISTDPGREGELIARLILMMSGNKKPIYRFWTSKALTPDAVREAFGSLKPGEEFDRLYHAAVARQQSDWLIGMNATRAFSVKHNARPPLSLGRVQTPTLRLIVDRELEIRNFKPQDYWLLRALFKHERGEYEALWFGEAVGNEARGEASTAVSDNERTAGGDIEESAEKDASSRIPSEAIAKQIMGRIHGKDGIIESCTHNVKKEPPPLLFSLTVLQQEANKLFGYSADQTLNIAQALYEKKLITYPRSDSQHLNDEMAKDVPDILQKLTGYKSVQFDISRCNVSGSNKRVFDSSKLTDHHALIPTGKLPEGLGQDEQNIYDLVARRFIAAFYPNFEFKTTVIITVVGQDRFKSSGKVVISSGWKEIYGSKDKDQLLPEMKEKDPVKTLKADIEKKQTTPPPRFTDASILEAMSKAAKYVTDPQLKKILKETAGIGTPATRSGILETLKKREYIIRKGKNIMPTEKGINLIGAVRSEPLSDVAYTAIWEQALDDIASGKVKSSDDFLSGIKKYTAQIVEKVKGLNAVISGAAGAGKAAEDGNGLGKCPDCGKPVVESRRAFGCSGYKEGCKFTIWKNSLERFGRKTIPAGMVKNLLPGKEVKITGLKSKAGKEYEVPGKLVKDEKWGWKIELMFGGK